MLDDEQPYPKQMDHIVRRYVAVIAINISQIKERRSGRRPTLVGPATGKTTKATEWTIASHPVFSICALWLAASRIFSRNGRTPGVNRRRRWLP